MTAASVVASTVVSSRMLAAIAADHGAQHVETLTGFKWLARADAGLPGAHAGLRLRGGDRPLRRSRRPCATRTASAPPCWPAIWSSRCGDEGRTVPDALDAWPAPRRAHHDGGVAGRRADEARGDGAAARDAAGSAGRLRRDGRPTCCRERGQQRTDALIFYGGDDGDRSGWRSGRRAPSRRSRLHRDSAARPVGDARATRAEARRRLGRAGRRRRTCFSAARTDGPPRRRARARCRRRR